MCTPCRLPGSPFHISFQCVRTCSICIGQEIQTQKTQRYKYRMSALNRWFTRPADYLVPCSLACQCISEQKNIDFFANHVGVDSFWITCSLWLALRSQDPMSEVSGVKGNWYFCKLDSTMKDSGRDSRHFWDSSSLEGDHIKASVWTPRKFWHQQWYKGEENWGWKRGNRRRGLAERED